LRAALIEIGLRFYGCHFEDLPETSRERLKEILALEHLKSEMRE